MTNSKMLHQITTIVGRHTPETGDAVTPIDGLFLSRRVAAPQAAHMAQVPLFGMVVQGQKSIELGGETQCYGVGDFLLVSFEAPVISRVVQASAAKPLLGLGLEISNEDLHDVLGQFDMTARSMTSRSAEGVAVARADDNLLDATLRLLKLLDTPADIAVMAPLIRKEIVYRLLCGPRGDRLVQLASLNSPGSRIAKIIAWLRQHFADTFHIAELARDAGMSESSLHHHFKAITRLTPMQYQKLLRLHEARRLIQLEQMDVGTASYAVGYQSRSQFSREYSRLYGLSPMQDAKRGQASRSAKS
jgi:AraC-like DNA-binding protein